MAIIFDSSDKGINLLTGNAQLLKNIGKINIGHIAQDREKWTKIIINLEHFELIVREISCRYRVSKIIKAKIDDGLLIE